MTLVRLHQQIFLQAEPLRPAHVGHFLVDELAVEVANELPDELMDLDKGKMLPNARP